MRYKQMDGLFNQLGARAAATVEILCEILDTKMQSGWLRGQIDIEKLYIPFIIFYPRPPKGKIGACFPDTLARKRDCVWLGRVLPSLVALLSLIIERPPELSMDKKNNEEEY